MLSERAEFSARKRAMKLKLKTGVVGDGRRAVGEGKGGKSDSISYSTQRQDSLD